jgi:hypothetical protein
MSVLLLIGYLKCRKSEVSVPVSNSFDGKAVEKVYKLSIAATKELC